MTKIAVSVLAALFGLLHIIAAAVQFRSKDPAARGSATLMVCGGIAMACAAIAHLAGAGPGWADALSAAPGGLLVCFAAYLNGRRSGDLHLSHHLVRGAIAALLVLGFALW